MANTSTARQPVLSPRATTIYAVIAAISFSAASSAPTPLYHLYQKTLGLTPVMVTVIFAAYVLALLMALLTVAKLSDHVGRRPMILAALVINSLALVVFITAASAIQLIAARVVQGAATGIALTTLGATILDTDRNNGPVLNSVTAFVGLMLGALLAGTLVSWAPFPEQLVYVVLLGISIAEMVLLLVVPETASLRPGALASIWPHVRLSPAAKTVLLQLLPVNFAGWALGGFYLSLMPTLVAVATHINSPFVGAAIVSVLMLAAAGAVFALRPLSVARLLATADLGLGFGIAMTLAGIASQSVPMMVVGTAIAGIGFGAAFSGNLRALLPLGEASERASLLAVYFIESYVVFAVPAIIAGILAPVLGLVATAYLYGGVLIVLTIISAVATRRIAKS